MKDAHNVVSKKSVLEETRKRSREEFVEELKSSIMFKQNPSRIRLLLETQRIINNSLPFCFGEYEESKILNDITVIPEMQMSLSAKKVCLDYFY